MALEILIESKQLWYSQNKVDYNIEKDVKLGIRGNEYKDKKDNLKYVLLKIEQFCYKSDYLDVNTLRRLMSAIIFYLRRFKFRYFLFPFIFFFCFI